MATVKGDVHDIGKNIVGVVLAVQQLRGDRPGRDGASDKILETAKREKADMIGLSGLITPSLDEMVHVAAEMEREGFSMPLLIGGATTSRGAHGGQDRAQLRAQPVVHVLDASRAVGVVSTLMSDTERKGYTETVRAEYVKIRDAYVRGESKQNPHEPGQGAREPLRHRLVGGQAGQADLPRHARLQELRAGRAGALHRLDALLPDLGAGRQISAIFDDNVVGPEARKLFDDAQALLKRIVAEKWLTANARDRLLAGQRRGRRYRPVCR